MTRFVGVRTFITVVRADCPSAPALTLSGQSTSDYFGYSLSTAGDVNGDGYADVIVDAYAYNAGTHQGRAYVYLGNGGAGLALAPRTRRASDSAPVAYLGQSESVNSFRLAALSRTPFGRGKVKLEWEVKPLGVLFNGSGTQRSAAWMDTGTTGAGLDELVTSLAARTAYHWRLRVLYNSVSTPFAQHSRWLTQPWNGWNETRIRTAPLRVYLPLTSR